MDEITSLSNPLVKRIRSLRSRKHRRREGVFWAEGIRIALEAIEMGWELEVLVWAPSLLRSEEARSALGASSVPKVAVSQRVFEGMSGRDNPQGLGALARTPARDLVDLGAGDGTFVAVLEGPQDPGNVGTVVRTVDCAGGDGVILIGTAADPYDPQSVRASMGSLFSVPVVTGVDASEFLWWARAHGMRTIGTSAGADRGYLEVSCDPPIALLFGSEKKGLSEELRAAADEVVGIPVRGRATSLNLASAVAVMAYRVPAMDDTRSDGREGGA